MEEIDLTETYACSYCWSVVESFHDFYGMVEANYQNLSDSINAKDSVNKLPCLKAENDLCTSVNESIYAESTSFWNDSNGELDSFKDEEKCENTKRSSAAAHQEFVALDRSHEMTKNRKSMLQKTKATLSTQTKSAKLESMPTESKSDRYKRIKAALITAEGFE